MDAPVNSASLEEVLPTPLDSKSASSLLSQCERHSPRFGYCEDQCPVSASHPHLANPEDPGGQGWIASCPARVQFQKRFLSVMGEQWPMGPSG